MRRRRRRSSFAPNAPNFGPGIWVAAAVAFIGGFWFLIHQADTHPPPQHEVSVELPDAFKE